MLSIATSSPVAPKVHVNLADANCLLLSLSSICELIIVLISGIVAVSIYSLYILCSYVVSDPIVADRGGW